MAAIDCFFTSSWDEYSRFVEWARTAHFTTPRGVRVDVIDWVRTGYTEDMFDGHKECKVFNTPHYIDNFLYHNCPLDFIQNWLRYAYKTDDWDGVDQILSEIPAVPDYKPCTKVKVLKRGFSTHPVSFRINGMTRSRHSWTVMVKDPNGNSMYHNEKYDFWAFAYELEDVDGSHTYTKSSIRAIIRKIIKTWKLPAGCEITICGPYYGDDWRLKTV